MQIEGCALSCSALEAGRPFRRQTVEAGARQACDNQDLIIRDKRFAVLIKIFDGLVTGAVTANRLIFLYGNQFAQIGHKACERADEDFAGKELLNRRVSFIGTSDTFSARLCDGLHRYADNQKPQTCCENCQEKRRAWVSGRIHVHDYILTRRKLLLQHVSGGLARH